MLHRKVENLFMKSRTALICGHGLHAFPRIGDVQDFQVCYTYLVLAQCASVSGIRKMQSAERLLVTWQV